MIRLTLPIRTISEANSHQHWRVRAKRAKWQRFAASLALRPWRHEWFPEVGNLFVTLTRIAPGTLDSDNLAGSQKHVRDGIADAFGIKDNDPRVTWTYAQRRGGKGVYAVEVEIGAR